MFKTHLLTCAQRPKTRIFQIFFALCQSFCLLFLYHASSMLHLPDVVLISFALRLLLEKSISFENCSLPEVEVEDKDRS